MLGTPYRGCDLPWRRVTSYRNVYEKQNSERCSSYVYIEKTFFRFGKVLGNSEKQAMQLGNW